MVRVVFGITNSLENYVRGYHKFGNYVRSTPLQTSGRVSSSYGLFGMARTRRVPSVMSDRVDLCLPVG
jgi:hypothetical protein